MTSSYVLVQHVGGEWKCIHTTLPTTSDAIYYSCDLWLTI